MSLKRTVSLLVLAAFGVALTTAYAGIRGSKHDFSAESWNTDGQICLPCHVPHNALNQQDVPLWNHEATSASFVLYDSPTLQVSPESPRGPSKSCLSCHDGTVALDSFGGKTGSSFIGGDALIGTDLSDDHPVSIKWQHQNDLPPGSMCFNCHTFSPTKLTSQLPFFSGYVECTTCHDPHGAEYPGLLRMSMDGSELCLHCHGK